MAPPPARAELWGGPKYETPANGPNPRMGRPSKTVVARCRVPAPCSSMPRRNDDIGLRPVTGWVATHHMGW